MSIKNLEIKPSEAKAVEIASLPTRPTSSATYGGRGLTAQEMKKAYDAYPALIKERFNALIADLLSGIAINDIPFSIPSHEPFGENIEQTVKGFLDAVGSILDFGTDDARTIFGFVKQFVSDVAMATSLEYDKSTQLLKLTIDGEEKSVTIDFSQFDQFETAISELRSTVQTLDVTKFDKSGGGITGDVHIGGSAYIGKDLTIAGNSIIQETEHLQVKDAVIVMNKDGEILTVPAGSVIRKGVNADGVDETYAIMYDPVSDSVKLGLVYQDGSGNYQFLAGEGYPVAIRADSSVMQDGMFAVWDAANRRFVTSDMSPSDVNSKLDAAIVGNIIYATDEQGNQTTLTIGEGLSVENGALKATVTPEDTTFAKTIKNYIDPSNIVANKYYNSSGILVNGSGCSAYNSVIELEPNTRYTISNFKFYTVFCFLGDGNSRVALSSFLNSDSSFTTDDTHIYLYLTFNTKQENPCLVNGEIPRSEVIYGYSQVVIDKLKDGMTLCVGANREIKTLKEGIELATKYNGVTLYVDEGTYDLVEEFGSEYLENNTTDTGLILKNNIHIIFSSKSKVIFNYTGSNSYIHTNFSPFNAGAFGFTLENMTLEASNCRYCVHDERSGSIDSYVNVYKSCSMKLDNSQNTDWANPQEIGGGLGDDGYVIIEDCVFHCWVTYHNNNDTGYTSSKSKIVVKNNVFQNGSFRIGSYGASTAQTVCIVTGNYWSQEPVLPSDNTGNVVVYEWGNILH